MTRRPLKTLSTEELVAEFEQIALDQDDARLDGDTSRYNRLFRETDEVDNELRARGLAARQALTSLYKHPNFQVQLRAAKRTLAVAPQQATDVLQRIQDSQEHPYAGEAGMTLWNLQRGTFKPD